MSQFREEDNRTVQRADSSKRTTKKGEAMKQVKVKIETTVETMLGDKPVNELLVDIADICHTSLEYSTSKNEGCETLYEDQEYEDYRNDMEDRVSVLEGTLCRILNLLED